MADKMNQRDRIMRHLQDFGGITHAEAMQEYGIQRLAARVIELRRKGVPIVTELVDGKNRYGEPTRYAVYRLAEVAQ